jgi:CRP/FNR family transcriptional regulator, cyclic AMP receptor protein
MPGFSCTPTTLKAVPFFSSLDDATICAALPHLTARTYSMRAPITIGGSNVDSLCLVLTGRVRIMQDDESGREAVIEELCEHEFFNEMGWLEGRTSSEAYVAGTPCTILFLPRQLLEHLLSRHATLAQPIMQAIAKRLTRAHRQIGRLALDTVYARVVDVLLERGHEEAGQWFVDAGAEFIATLVGASREMVSRVVADLIRRGLVRRLKRQLIVADRALLETYAKDNRTSLRVQANGFRSTPRPCATTGEQLFA